MISRLSSFARKQFRRFPLVDDFLNPDEIQQRQRMLAHGSFGRTPAIPAVIVPDLDPVERDVSICSRLLAAYRLSSSDPRPASDIWSDIRASQNQFFGHLHRGAPEELAAYLCNMSRHDATIGTVQGDAEYQRIRQDPVYRRFVALMTKDKLVSLAEALGIIPCENPEQGVYGESLHRDAGELVEGISRKLGISIVPPAIDGGLLKIQVGAGLFNERDLNAVFTAFTLAQHRPSSLCEIGAGSGRVAYWSHRLGIQRYTLIDLPQINVVQGFYLLKALPDAPIRLHGEPPAEGTTILPSEALETVGKIDLVLNQDSFPEIERGIVVKYLEWIKGNALRFLSINHESRPPHNMGRQLSVPEIVSEVGGLKLRSRVPYWLRKGYVMELYEVE